MPRLAFAVAVVVAALVLPASASATHDTPTGGPGCDYTANQQVSSTNTDGTSTVVVYADPDPTPAGGGGSSGTAQTSAGVCVETDGSGGFWGGVAEVGANEDPAVGPDDATELPGGTDAYAVIDGDNRSTCGGGQCAGYGALSTWEASTTPGADDTTCDSNDTGSGSNSGGCVTVRNLPPPGPTSVSQPVPFVACGNTSGKSWDDSQRDGCQIP